MIAKIQRGQKISGLMVYLLGEGDHNEHRNRHIVAASSTVMRSEWLQVFDGPADKRRSRDAGLAVAHEIDMPRALYNTPVRMRARKKVAAGVGGRELGMDVVEPAAKGEESVLKDAPVWHCVLSLSPGEELTDAQWDRVIGDFMREMGFEDPKLAPSRWAAVRHGHSGEHGEGQDHIHIAASLVREDGSKVDTYDYGPGHAKGDWKRSKEACATLERRYGLTILESREQGGELSGDSRAEIERVARGERVETEREELRRVVRSCAAAAVNEAEFIRRVRAEGIAIFPRWEEGGRNVVGGYSVQLRGENGVTGPRLGGTLLASDLSLPELRQDWDTGPEASKEALEEWRSLRRGSDKDRDAQVVTDPQAWRKIAEDVRRWNEWLDSIPREDRVQWAYAARRTSAMYGQLSKRVEGNKPAEFAATAKELARAAQLPTPLRRQARKATPVKRPSVRGVVAVLAQMDRRRDSDSGLLLLVEQLMLAVAAIGEARVAADDYSRAVYLTGEIREKLERSKKRLTDRAARERTAAVVQVVELPFQHRRDDPGPSRDGGRG